MGRYHGGEPPHRLLGQWKQRCRHIALGYVSCAPSYGDTLGISSADPEGSGHTAPSVYTGAALQVLKTGTHTNSTHWQVTVKCSGCTSYSGSSGTKILTPTGTNRLAFAYSQSKPSSPSSNTSSFPVHDVTNYWSHDFSSAGNANFAALVTKDS
jgi:hypothetical protein